MRFTKTIFRSLLVTLTATMGVTTTSFALDLQKFVNNSTEELKQLPGLDFLNAKTVFAINPLSVAELTKYENYSPQKATAVISAIDSLLLKEAANLQRQIEAKNFNCTPDASVNIVEATGDSDFDSSLVKISLTACLPKYIRADRAAETFLSPHFNIQAFSQVQQITIKGPYICQVNSVKFKGNSNYCSQPVIYQGKNGLIIIKNSIASNASNADVPLYLKESLILFQPTPNGVIYRYIGYSRSIEINRFLKSFVLSTIRNAQGSSVPVLVNLAK